MFSMKFTGKSDPLMDTLRMTEQRINSPSISWKKTLGFLLLLARISCSIRCGMLALETGDGIFFARSLSGFNLRTTGTGDSLFVVSIMGFRATHFLIVLV